MPRRPEKFVAMNDAVITAGPPFRMIELDLAIDPQVSGRSALTYAGDGMIVSTAAGSTAYNLSVGGPIVAPAVDAFVISAIAPQSIAFRPIVFGAESDVWVTMLRANEGTTLVIDGQRSLPLEGGPAGPRATAPGAAVDHPEPAAHVLDDAHAQDALGRPAVTDVTGGRTRLGATRAFRKAKTCGCLLDRGGRTPARRCSGFIEERIGATENEIEYARCLE